MVLGLTAALLAAALFGAISALQAAVIRNYGLFSVMMIGVLIGNLVGWVLHLVAIAELPLYLAQVGVSSSLVVTALIASSVMGEPLRTEHWWAIGAMVVGLGVLALAAGDVGTSSFSDRTTIALYALLILVTAFGWLTWRWQHPASGVILGTLAGMAFGCTPIATRALVDFTWDLNTLATACSVVLFGAVGFVLYSLSLKRASVTAATAPQILLQTVIPSIVGITLFDDGVRDGWWPAALTAFGFSIAAGILLCGTEPRVDILEELKDQAL